MRELELYIHIPFCMKKCNYCDFLSAPADEKSQSAYVEALKKEIKFFGKELKAGELSTIYIGGGTPSWLQEHYMASIMETVHKFFSIKKDAEITIECNPGTLTRAKINSYRHYGINRLSLGLQSADDEELKALGRIHTFDQFLRNFELARECGFDNINVDLMYALPRQNTEKFYRTLTKTIGLKPEHISAYALMIEKGTPFYEKYKFDAVRQEAGFQPEVLPHEDVVYQIGKMTEDVLSEAGYERYEISNYAKKGYGCRHNIGYWQREEYLGVGLGAASLIGGNLRYSNLKDLDTYILQAEDIRECVLTDDKTGKELPAVTLHENAQELKRNAQMEEFMFLGLRMIQGIERSRFYQSFGFTVDNIYSRVIARLEAEELIGQNPERVWLTEKGLDLSNYALAQFLLD